MKASRLLPLISLLILCACEEKETISPYEYGLAFIKEDMREFSIIDSGCKGIGKHGNFLDYKIEYKVEQEFDYQTYSVLYTTFLFECEIYAYGIETLPSVNHKFNINDYKEISFTWTNQYAE